MSPYKTFETERLILKPTLEEDAAFIYELFNTPKWLKTLGTEILARPKWQKSTF